MNYTKASVFVPHLPLAEQTEEVCLNAIKNSAFVFQYLNPEAMTPAVCRAAVSFPISIIQHVPLEKRTDEIIDLALQHCGCSLIYLTNEQKTYQRCLTAVSDKYGALITIEHIPHEYMTHELLITAAKTEPRILELLPKKYQFDEICEIVVGLSGLCLEYVVVQSPKICAIAVQQCGLAIQYVKNQTPYLCYLAFTNYPDCVEFINDKTPEMIKHWNKIQEERFQFYTAHSD